MLPFLFVSIFKGVSGILIYVVIVYLFVCLVDVVFWGLGGLGF